MSTALENALREALGSDVDVSTAPTIEGVRRGAQRRRNRRNVVAAVAATVAVIAGVGIGASLLDGPDKAGPDPAPSPSVVSPTTTEDSTDAPVTSATAPPGIVAVDSVGDDLYVMTATSGLWLKEASAWRQVNAFDSQQMRGLGMAPDGRNGLAVAGEWSADTLFATHDGGETWTQVELPVRKVNNVQFDVSATYAWAVDKGRVFRSPVGEDQFEEVPVDGISPFDVIALGDAVAVTSGDGSGSTMVTRDDGATWTDLPGPCTVPTVRGAETVLIAVCPSGTDTEISPVAVYRSADLETWDEVTADAPASHDGAGGEVWPLTDDLLLVTGGQQGALMTASGDTTALSGAPVYYLIGSVAAIGDRIYIAEAEGRGGLVSEDGGITWQKLK